MDLMKTLKARKSIRGYKSNPVPQKILREILETAVRAPSADNSQPWEITVITGQVLRDLALADLLAGQETAHEALAVGGLEDFFRQDLTQLGVSFLAGEGGHNRFTTGLGLLGPEFGGFFGDDLLLHRQFHQLRHLLHGVLAGRGVDVAVATNEAFVASLEAKLRRNDGLAIRRSLERVLLGHVVTFQRD